MVSGEVDKPRILRALRYTNVNMFQLTFSAGGNCAFAPGHNRIDYRRNLPGQFIAVGMAVFQNLGSDRRLIELVNL